MCLPLVITDLRLRENGDGHVFVGGLQALEGWGVRRMSRCRRVPLGFVSVWLQKGSEGQLRLRWRPPGASDYEPVPPALLTHQPSDRTCWRSPRQAAQVGLDWLQSAALSWQKTP